MSDELTFVDKILTAVILAMGGGIGIQRYQQSRIEKAIDEHAAEIKDIRTKLRSKEDCGDICMNFLKTQERMSVDMAQNFREMRAEIREDIQRLYDKIERKEDKHE